MRSSRCRAAVIAASAGEHGGEHRGGNEGAVHADVDHGVARIRAAQKHTQQRADAGAHQEPEHQPRGDAQQAGGLIQAPDVGENGGDTRVSTLAEDPCDGDVGVARRHRSPHRRRGRLDAAG
jgi:hypothetical protein